MKEYVLPLYCLEMRKKYYCNISKRCHFFLSASTFAKIEKNCNSAIYLIHYEVHYRYHCPLTWLVCDGQSTESDGE